MIFPSMRGEEIKPAGKRWWWFDMLMMIGKCWYDNDGDQADWWYSQCCGNHIGFG